MMKYTDVAVYKDYSVKMEACYCNLICYCNSKESMNLQCIRYGYLTEQPVSEPSPAVISVFIPRPLTITANSPTSGVGTPGFFPCTRVPETLGYRQINPCSFFLT